MYLLLYNGNNNEIFIAEKVNAWFVLAYSHDIVFYLKIIFSEDSLKSKNETNNRMLCCS